MNTTATQDTALFLLRRIRFTRVWHDRSLLSTTILSSLEDTNIRKPRRVLASIHRDLTPTSHLRNIHQERRMIPRIETLGTFKLSEGVAMVRSRLR